MKKLLKLIESIPVLESKNVKDAEVHNIAYHSGKVKPGDLFVCIKGFETDGHKYASQAVDKGACALIVEDYQENLDVPQFKVENSRKALASLGAAFYDYPSKKIKMIGITATNGKTSTSFMTNAILEAHGLKTGLIGTVMVKYGNYMEPSILTTPESLDLQSHFARMVEENITYNTMEVSSSALAFDRVHDVDFDIVTLNNISREHIDLHGSFEEYFETKSSLIRNAKPHQWAILNLDDTYSASLVEQTKAQVLTFGIKNTEATLVCSNLDLTTGRGRFTVKIQRPFTVGNTSYAPQEFDIALSVPGYHSVYNSMVAIAVGLLCEIPIPTIIRGLNSFVGVERRFQFIFEDDFKIVDDHFANPGNINVTLETLNFMDYNRLYMIYAIRGSRGVTTNKENAETIVNWASKLGLTEIIATLSQSHVSKKDVVSPEELDVFLEVMKKANIKVNLYSELPDAISCGLKNAKQGDVLMLAGCQGMDYGAQIALEQLYNERPYLNKEILFRPLESRVAGIV